MHCTVLCSSWCGLYGVGRLGPLSGMNPKDLIGCVVPPHALAGCGGTQAQVPGYPEPLPARSNPGKGHLAAPASRSLPANCGTVCVSSQQFHVRLFDETPSTSHHSINLHNAQRSNPALTSPGTTALHWATLHDIIEHYITLHYTSSTPRWLASFSFVHSSPVSLSVSLVSAVVSPISARLCLPSVP